MALARVWLRFGIRVWGIVVQILSGFIQFSTAVENEILTFLLPRLTKPQQFGITLAPGDTVAKDSGVLRTNDIRISDSAIHPAWCRHLLAFFRIR
jgi:hypothetical protein